MWCMNDVMHRHIHSDGVASNRSGYESIRSLLEAMRAEFGRLNVSLSLSSQFISMRRGSLHDGSHTVAGRVELDTYNLASQTLSR